MSKQLQMDAFAKNSLNRLPTEIKEMIVAMVELQDIAYQTRRRMYARGTLDPDCIADLPGDFSKMDFANAEDGKNLVGEEYETASECDAAVHDERRKWRRLLGKGISSVFRVNREFAALATPHLFKTFYSSAFANPQHRGRALLPKFRTQHFQTIDFRSPTFREYAHHESIALSTARRLPNARRLIIDESSAWLLSDPDEEGHLLTMQDDLRERFIAMAEGIESLVMHVIYTSSFGSVIRHFTTITTLTLVLDGDGEGEDGYSVVVHVVSYLPTLKELRYSVYDEGEKDSTWWTLDRNRDPEWSVEGHLDAVAKLPSVSLERMSWRMDQFIFLDVDFIHSFGRTLRYLDIGIGDTSVLLFFAIDDAVGFSFPLLTTLKIAGSADSLLLPLLSVFTASPLSELTVNHSDLVDALHGTAFVESLRNWRKTLKSLTLDSPAPYRHSTHLRRLDSFCEEVKIHLVLRGDYLMDRLDFDRDGEEGDAEVRELAALGSKLSGLLELAMGENDRALAMGDDRGLFELWNDCGGLMDQERFIEMAE